MDTQLLIALVAIATCCLMRLCAAALQVWEVDPSKHESGLVQHTLFWPSGNDVYAGSFLYHMDPNLVLAGYVVGLDYKNPYLSPYEEFQVSRNYQTCKDS